MLHKYKYVVRMPSLHSPSPTKKKKKLRYNLKNEKEIKIKIKIVRLINWKLERRKKVRVEREKEN